MLRISVVVLCGLILACGRKNDEEEVAQAAGDVLASADEGLEGGGLALLRAPYLNRPEFRERTLFRTLVDAAIPSAEAAGRCFTETFSACANGVRTRTFDQCTLGPSTLEGSVTLTFSDAAGCTVNDANESVTRAADFTLTGPRGGTLKVSAPGGGQKLTRGTDSWKYSVLGMQRVAADKNGKKLFDVSTKTLSDVTITGQNRANRVLNGGELEISHNLANYKVVLSPENLTWSSACNCPVSGKLNGTASGSVSGSFVVEMTGCGTAKVTNDGETKDVTLDRCASL